MTQLNKFRLLSLVKDSWRSIGENQFLQIFYWVLWFGFFVSFYSWSYRDFGTTSNACWPFFQSCHQIQFLPGIDESYGYIGVVIGLVVLLALSGYYAVRKDWVKALGIFSALFFVKLFTFTLLSYTIPGNFEYFHLSLLFAFLFLRPKIYALKLTMISLLFLSATMKFHDAWILGTYFSSLKLGLPFFPDSLIPIATNSVILLEIVCPWLLLSRNQKLKRLSILLFAGFLFYSISLVGMHYQAFSLLPFLVLFLFDDLGKETASNCYERRLLAASILLLFLLHLPAHFLPGDNRISLQGYKLGVWMFDSNHQCVSNQKFFYSDGTDLERKHVSSRAMTRCAPYYYWYKMQRKCKEDSNILKVEWTFDHSINGGPFYRIVELRDACETSYSFLGENDWLDSNPTEDKIVGYPRKNYPTRDSDSHPKIVFDTESIALNSLQDWLAPSKDLLRWIWICLWWLFCLAYLPKTLWALLRPNE